MKMYIFIGMDKKNIDAINEPANLNDTVIFFIIITQRVALILISTNSVMENNNFSF